MNENVSSNEEIRKEARKRFVYKHLSTRQYACPKGYRSYDDVITIMAINIELAELGLELEQYQWMWLCAVDVMARAALKNIFPVFRVETDLLQLLIETEDPKPFKDVLPVPFESALFLFPKNAIRIGKWKIDWLLVDTVDRSSECQTFHFDKGEIVFNRMSQDAAQTYRWVTQPESGEFDSPGDLFVSTFGYKDDRAPCDKKTIAAKDGLEATQLLDRLARHLLLWLYQPLPREYEVVEVTRARGFGKSASAVPPAVYPIKLGLKEQPHKIYRPQCDRPRDPCLTPRKSPRAHVRCAHWRNVPVGKREDKKREPRVILATTVNTPKD